MWLLKPLSELGSISRSYFNCFTCKAINNRGQVALICFTEAKEKHLLISFNNYIGTTFNLLSNAVYIVGRKDCEILLPSDQAVSRKHAQIKVSHLENNIVSL